MDAKLAIICLLTFIIHLIGTLAYSVRIAGVRTRRIAITLALFNILVLVSRTSNLFQGPLLAKRVEEGLGHPGTHDLLADFRWLLFSATLATLAGAFLIPTFQRVFSKQVMEFQTHRSMPRLLLRMFFKNGLVEFKSAASLPVSANITALNADHAIPVGMIALNVLVAALWTIAVFAALYAGYLNPRLRVTAISLSSLINGFATVLMFVIIDPQLSVLTDDVVEGKATESSFRRTIVWLVGSRLAGTLLAQVILVPAAHLIVFVAERL